MSDLAFYLPLLLLAISLKVLLHSLPRFQTPRAKLAAHLGFLALFALLYALLLAYVLGLFSMMSAYGPALIVGLSILLMQAILVLFQHVTRSKRTLTERQKLELMDL